MSAPVDVASLLDFIERDSRAAGAKLNPERVQKIRAAFEELTKASAAFVNDDRTKAWHPSYRPMLDRLRAALEGVGMPA